MIHLLWLLMLLPTPVPITMLVRVWLLNRPPLTRHWPKEHHS